MLGFNKPTAIFIILSFIVGYGSKDWKNGAVLFSIFAVCMIVWKLLTK